MSHSYKPFHCSQNIVDDFLKTNGLLLITLTGKWMWHTMSYNVWMGLKWAWMLKQTTSMAVFARSRCVTARIVRCLGSLLAVL